MEYKPGMDLYKNTGVDKFVTTFLTVHVGQIIV